MLSPHQGGPFFGLGLLPLFCSCLFSDVHSKQLELALEEYWMDILLIYVIPLRRWFRFAPQSRWCHGEGSTLSPALAGRIAPSLLSIRQPEELKGAMLAFLPGLLTT